VIRILQFTAIMSNIIANDSSQVQSRCKQDVGSKLKGMSVLRDPRHSKVRFSGPFYCTTSLLRDLRIGRLRSNRIRIGKNLLLDLQRKLYIINIRWQVKKGR